MVKLICFFSIFLFGLRGTAEMKEWELYCWLDKAEVKYALLPGTNRLKEEKEIIHNNNNEPLTFDRLMKKLTKLKNGESVILEDGGVQSIDSKLIPIPPRDKEQILVLCNSRRLKCLSTQ